MTPETKKALADILAGDPWKVRSLVQHLIDETETIEKHKGQRTSAQNRALHLGLGMIATALNGAGLDIRKVLKPEINVDWNVETVKEYLWRPVQKLVTQKESTTELSKQQEIDEVWNTVMRFLTQNHHIEYIPFPSSEPLRAVQFEQMDNLHNEDYPEQDESTMADKFD